MRKTTILGLALLLIATPALAVDFDTVLLDQQGRPQRECTKIAGTPPAQHCETEVDLTLGLLARFALDRPEPNLVLSDILKRGSLSEKIRVTSNLDLSVDEAKLIKDQIVRFPYNVGVKFQAIRLIDPKGTEETK